MKAYAVFYQLLKRTWFLLVISIIFGWILGIKFQEVYEVEMYGFPIVLAAWSFGVMWAGLIVGYRTPKK